VTAPVVEIPLGVPEFPQCGPRIQYRVTEKLLTVSRFAIDGVE